MWLFAVVFIISSLKLENLLGDNILTKLLPLLTLAVGIARFSLFRRGRIYVGRMANQVSYLFFWLFILALVIGFMRTHLPTASIVGIANASLQPIMLSWFIYVSINYFVKEEGDYEEVFRKITWLIILGVAIIAFMNLASFILSFGSGAVESNNSHEPPVFLAMMGIHINKVEFPLSGGHPNGVGMFAGGVLSMSVAYFIWIKKKPESNLLQFSIIGMLTIVLLIADSRATIGNSIMTVLIIYALDKIRQLKSLKYLVLVAPFFPFIMLSTLALIANLSFVANLSRGENDLATGNSRSIIWENIMAEFEELQVEHIIGYGEWGTHPAGAYLNYLDIFEEDDLEKDILYQFSIAHNSFFQAVFDIGLIGAFLFYATIYIGMKQTYLLHKNGVMAGTVMMHFVLYFLLSGITESSFGRYNLTLFMVFLVNLATVFAFENEFLKNKIKNNRKLQNENSLNEHR